MVLLAMGFTGAAIGGAVADIGVQMGPRGTVATDGRFRTAADGVFAAGDARRGASLIVWAIREGRDAARAIDVYLSESNARAGATGYR
jgi:glutamate synthase (NADPH/NADH) small chain